MRDAPTTYLFGTGRVSFSPSRPICCLPLPCCLWSKINLFSVKRHLTVTTKVSGTESSCLRRSFDKTSPFTTRSTSIVSGSFTEKISHPGIPGELSNQWAIKRLLRTNMINHLQLVKETINLICAAVSYFEKHTDWPLPRLL